MQKKCVFFLKKYGFFGYVSENKKISKKVLHTYAKWCIIINMLRKIDFPVALIKKENDYETFTVFTRLV